MKNFQKVFSLMYLPLVMLLASLSGSLTAQCTLACPNDISQSVPFGTCSESITYVTPPSDNDCSSVINNFTGELGFGNWQFNTSGDGTRTSSGITTVNLTSSNNGMAGSTQYCITLDFHDFETSTGQEINTSNGMFSFSWNYNSTESNASDDAFYFVNNGVDNLVTAGVPGTGTGAANQNNSSTYAVSDGTEICFDQRSYDGVGGTATTNISNVTLTYIYTPTLVSGFASGGDFPLGTTTVVYEIYNTDINQRTSCEFDVTITENGTAVGGPSCNNGVQISLDENCEAIVTPDQILEGDNYGCYDKYTVDIMDANGNSIGNTVTSVNVGQTLDVRVYDNAANPNSCWGTIIIEDKNPPLLDCRDVWTRCKLDANTATATDPGDVVPTSFTISNTPNMALSEGMASSSTFNTNYDIMLNELNGFTISDLNIALDVSHPNISDLSASVSLLVGSTTTVGPISLFDFTSTSCSTADLDLTFDDESSMSYSSLVSTCGASAPAFSGTSQAQALLSAFDGSEASGILRITFTDQAVSAAGPTTGILNSVTVSLTQEEGIVSFPGPIGASYTSTGTNQFTTNDIDPCGPVTLNYNDDIIEQPCTSPYIRTIQRTWSVVDASNNTSSCTQTIYVFRNDLSDLVWPPHYDGSTGNNDPLPACAFNGNGPVIDTSTDPSITGVPTGSFCENVEIFEPEDTRIDICAKSYKLIRKWKVVDWCSGEILEYDQIIKVEDTDGPDVTCTNELTIPADPYSCTGTFTVVEPTFIRDCTETNYEVSYVFDTDNDCIVDPNAVYIDDNVTTINGVQVITGLPFGCTWVRYRVFDECGNYTDCYTEVFVTDQTPPIAVCDEFTVVSLGADGWATILAETFDDGSNDNCEIDYFEVRKITDVCGISGNTTFGPSVQFCCAEFDQTIQVEFRVFDKAGLSNTCTVDVTVQDKLGPVILSCPADVTLDCQVENVDLSVYEAQVEFIDNCGATIETLGSIGDLDQCGEGSFTITYKVTDAAGLTDQCFQTFIFEDLDPFTFGDIDWPNNYDSSSSANNCNPSLEPEDLPEANAYPELDDDFCSLTASTFEDQSFYVVEGACVKVIRTWTVIDWCTYDANTNTGIYTNTQILKVNNLGSPEFTSTCADRSECIYGDDCDGSVTFVTSVTDDCTAAEDIQVEWTLTGAEDDGGTYSNSGEGISFDRTLEPGDYTITWTAEDHCGNLSTCSYNVRVNDCKAPTPYCHSTVASAVMDVSGTLSIWANDFDLGSFDNCTDQGDLRFSFSSNVNQTSVTFTCNDIPDGESNLIELQMWVTDEANNQDYCTVYIDLQDNEAQVCDGPSNGFAYLRGNIYNANNQMVTDVEVSLQSNQSGVNLPSIMTESDGAYTFTNLPHFGTYSVEASKDIDIMNGVSTLDLVLIQKHILGIQTFDSPYKTIASDINNNGTVSATDLIGLRKVILGINNEFGNDQESWRFVEKDHNFVSNTDVFPYDENINLVSITQSFDNQDFIAIKIGDVNTTANPSQLTSNQDLENRSSKTQVFTIEDREVTKGSLISIPVSAKDFNDMIGYQMSIDFDHTMLDYVGYESGIIDVSDANFGLTNVKEGVITTSWSTIEPLSISDQDELFTFTFRVNDNVTLSEALTFNSIITDAEAYNAELEVMEVALEWRGTNGNMDFSLEQNTPNPFNATTSIVYKVANSGLATLSVYDVTGRLLVKRNQDAAKGANTFELSSEEINTNGIMYYTVEINGHKATKKMILID